ncbi:SDR family NAD(P)-dependent oxidoreductase [Epilithonimonas hungarica]|uniref:3-oxoacyl-[acyl-carrier protein] reductase n=1 Tax=Epilithonimonas hungarica TaxID=454006 RepID=A0A1G7S9W0_9FLAO|nr:glucose 1-dehydrogenase [Epilithonimonas hungarica]SDG19835.1 3-oxoacyl-[acyl-carrier protein] reductase [Epilithonimonas hungarica]
MNRLKNKAAIITGAASGIGKQQALLFAKEGAKVALGDLNEEKVQEVVKEIKDNGGDAIGFKMDITNNVDIDNLIAHTLSAFGKISILCNTAGMYDQFRNLLDTDEAFWNKILEINITGLYKVNQRVLPHMIENKYGVIVNIASGAAVIGGGGGIAYTSSKHAVVGFTKQLNAEWGLNGIRANAIVPGLINTPMVKGVIMDDPNSPIMDTLKKIPAGRYGEPKEVADLSLFLASDDSKYIYGAIVPIDGGMFSTLR